MDVLTIRSRPFGGWEKLRRRFLNVGPERTLRFLVRRVHEHMSQHGLTFAGDEWHNYLNHSAAARILLKLWVENPSASSAIQPLSRAEMIEISHLLGELNEVCFIKAPSHRYSLGLKSRKNILRNVAERSWVEILQRANRQTLPAHEISRAALLARHYWPLLRDRVPVLCDLPTYLSEPLTSAFDSLEQHYGFALSLFTSGYWIDDPGDAFGSTTLSPLLQNVLSIYIPAADEIVGSWDDIERCTCIGLDSTFERYPIVRVGKCVIAPDPGVVLSCFDDFVAHRLMAHYQQPPETDLARTSEESQRRLRIGFDTLRGYLFESYVSDLLGFIAENSSDVEFVPEFALTDDTRSPDGFLKGTCILVFEAKATHHPAARPEVAELSNLFSWMCKLCGERRVEGRDEGRPPLRQGLRFFEEWLRGDDSVVDKLGTVDRLEAFYVIVSKDEVPYVVHSEQFRESLWRPELDMNGRLLDKFTLFISIRDLETLAAVSAHQRQEGSPVDTTSLVKEWRAYWLGKKALLEKAPQGERVGLNLGEWLRDRWPKAMSSAYPPLREAHTRLLALIGRTMFDPALEHIG